VLIVKSTREFSGKCRENKTKRIRGGSSELGEVLKNPFRYRGRARTLQKRGYTQGNYPG